MHRQHILPQPLVRLLNLCLVLVLFFGVVPGAQAQAEVPSNVHPVLLQLAAERPNEKVPVIIQKAANDNQVEAMVTQHGGNVTQDLSLIRSVAVELPAAAVLAIARTPAARWISLDAPVVAATTIDTSRLVSTYVRSVGADRIWNESPYIQGQGITVAVVDSGIQSWDDVKRDPSGSNRYLAWVNYSSNSLPNSQDYHGHGTHVAGIIGGNGLISGGEYMGIAPKVNLVSVKISNDEGASRTSDVVAGMQWVLANKATYNIRVVNISLNSTVAESYHTNPLTAAAELLWFNGIVVVVSAGNNGNGTGAVPVFPPANDPFVISVGAADERGTATIGDDVVTSFSAWGVTPDGHAKPDLVAPSRGIVSLIGRSDAYLMRTYPGYLVKSSNQTTPTYFRMSGTSMAAPVVAGAAALLLQDEPHLTPDQVKYRLMATARPLTSPIPGSTGAGYLDVYAAVKGTTTQSANTGVPVSQMIGTGTSDTLWNSVNWNSVNWNSVNWNSVNWNSVNWNSVNWNSWVAD